MDPSTEVENNELFVILKLLTASKPVYFIIYKIILLTCQHFAGFLKFYYINGVFNKSCK